jgi:SWI/SNF-related matrix-associated actin-dependent regulator 1 of chromatin subfamily A
MRTKRVLLLTGTPIMSKPVEMYNLLRCLRPDIFHSFKDFGFRYCHPKEEHYGIDWGGVKNQRELHLLLEGSLMIRRMKTDVLTELPSKRRQKIAISTDSNMVKKIHWMLKRIKTWSDRIGRHGENIFGAMETDFETFIKEKGLEDPNIARLDDKAAYLINAYNMTGAAKIKGILEFCATLIESKTKFIIFAHHFKVLEEQIIKKKVSHVRIDGKIEAQKRYEAVRKFQTEPECRVAILSLTSCSTGITLTAASTVVFAEMTWTPGTMV